VFVALGESGDWSTGTSLQLGFVVTLLVGIAGVVGAGRLPKVLPGTEGERPAEPPVPAGDADGPTVTRADGGRPAADLSI
jgi:hypothetical protein